jgi:hypothetical protein
MKFSDFYETKNGMIEPTVFSGIVGRMQGLLSNLCAWIMLERTKSSRNTAKVPSGNWISSMNSWHKICHSRTIWLSLDLQCWRTVEEP